jgi:Pentapeptide repeats (8 copies)
VVSGAVCDGVEAGADTAVPGQVADLDVRDSRWVDADLTGRRFTGLQCRNTLFEHCDLSGAVLDGAALRHVAFVNCRLTGTVLSGATLDDVRISDCRADLASLRMARAGYLLVESTVLRGADFYEFSGTGCGLLDASSPARASRRRASPACACTDRSSTRSVVRSRCGVRGSAPTSWCSWEPPYWPDWTSRCPSADRPATPE